MINQTENADIITFVQITAALPSILPYKHHNTDDNKKFHNIHIDKSFTDLVLKLCKICGTKEIVDVVAARNPTVLINICHSPYAGMTQIR